jgi:predicted lipid-binding transport protein (Tim44 family)
VRDNSGEIVEGDEKKVKRQKDTWTFARHMGSDDPNWQLVATGE